MKPSRNIRTLVVIPADIHEALKEYATRNLQYNGSVSGVIRAAVGEFVRTRNLQATYKQPPSNLPAASDDDDDGLLDGLEFSDDD
jgi:hypothetical protein